MTTTDEAHVRSRYQLAVGSRDRASETVLDVLTQPCVCRELRNLRAARASLRVPLRRRRPVHDRIATGRRVTAQLPRDRRRRPTKPARDPAYPDTLTGH